MENKITKRRSGKRPKKHRFQGNQFSKKEIPEKKNVSASSRKLDQSLQVISADSDFKGYCFIDKNIVFKMIEKYLTVCSCCGGNLSITSSTMGGLSEKITIMCNYCGELSSTRNSAMIGKKKNCAEINSRFLYAMRSLGQGLAGAKTFCGIMDLHPPIQQKAYKSVLKNIKNASSLVAKKSMCSAVQEEIACNDGNLDLTISGDGSWKTRGHTSLVGVCTVIGALCGKVIDKEVLSSYCKGCEVWKGKQSGEDYNKWFAQHSITCQKNHSGSAAMMEVVGMQRIFHRSIVLHNVRYAQYIGDGDCKTFNAVQQSQPYDKNFVISKIECIGHIQKRLGSRLRKRKLQMKGKKLSDGKTLGGKGRLTDDVINKLSIYYGNAIRQHCDSVREMQKAVWAIFYHKRSTDLEPTHQFCPTGEDSWCTYQRAHSLGLLQSHKHKNSIPPAVMDAVKDIFKDLSMPSLLKKCLGGYTQNPNESFNSLIWKLCPKNSGCASNVVQIAVNEAVVLFNNGQNGRLSIMQELGYQIGENTKSFAFITDHNRIHLAEIKAEMATLEARRARKKARIIAEHENLESEGVVYAAGEY